jgi:hypothetical protein
MSSAVMLIILFPQKSWWSHVPTVHQRPIGLGDPVWRSLRVAEYHQDGTSLCPGKVEGSNPTSVGKKKWKNRSPMLSKCPHVAYVASGFFHVQMVAHGCLMIADFWWFLMISAWPASHLRSHHEDSHLGAWRPSLRGANWNSLGHNMVLSKSGSILINLADFGFNQYPMISELWLTTWCRIWCESVDMI